MSSQIEGTQSTLDDVLAFEINTRNRGLPRDVAEVVNYVNAMNYGRTRLAEFPLSLRLLREIHARLLEGTRGSERQPGEFRISQNWIAPEHAPLAQAVFIPPPVPDMMNALDNFERFLHEERDLPLLIHCGLAHAQFETIHPFLDGNGRMGRLLITFLLCHRGALSQPLLYLSYYLKRNHAEYYDRLTAIREQGSWEEWLRFFLRGVAQMAEEATDTARAIVRLRDQHRALVQEKNQAINGLRVLDLLFQRPLITVNLVKDSLSVAFATANTAVEGLESLGILQEITGQERFRIFRYTPYLALFEETPPVPEQDVPVQSTTTGV